MQMMFFCLILLTISFSKINSIKSKSTISSREIDDNLFYDDTYFLKKIQIKNFKDELIKGTKQKRSGIPIKNLREYIDNLENSFNINNKYYAENGNCMNIVDFKKLFYNNQNVIENIENLQSHMNFKGKNHLFNDENGNMIIYSVCTDLFDYKCYEKIFFVSKIDFKFYEFFQSGEKLPKMTGFAIDYVIDKPRNTNYIYIYGGIDNRGVHNKDLFKLEIDYTFGSVKIIKSGINGKIPNGVAEATINSLFFSKKEKDFSAPIGPLKHLLLTFGGINDENLSNKIYSFDPELHTWTNVLNLKQGRKGHSSIIVPAEMVGQYDDIKLNKNLMKTFHLIIFGGKTDVGYSTGLTLVQINYMMLDDVFFYKELNVITTGDIPKPREGHRVIYRDNFMYLFGGCNFQLNTCFNDEIYRLDLNLLNALKNENYHLKWEKLVTKNIPNEYLDEHNMNIQHFMGHFINFGQCNKSMGVYKCGNNPQLILNNASCNCNNFINVFDGKLGQFVLKCKNSETEDIFLKKEIKGIENEIEHKLLKNVNKIVENVINFNMTTREPEWITKNFSNITKIDKNVSEIQSKVNKTLVENKNQTFQSNNHTKISNTSIKTNKVTNNSSNSSNNSKVLTTFTNTTNITSRPSSINIPIKNKNQTSTVKINDTKSHHKKNKTHHKKNKTHHKNITHHNYNIGQPQVNSNYRSELNNILKEAIKEIKANIQPIIKENEILKKAIKRDDTIDSQDVFQIQNIIDFMQLPNDIKHNKTSENKEYINKLSNNVSDIKNSLKKLNDSTKTNNEIKSDLELLIKKIEINKNIMDNKLESFNKFIKEQVSFNKKVEEIKEIKCINGYLIRNFINKTETLCECLPGFTGITCEMHLYCKDQCNNNGMCKFGKCYCDPGYFGDSCEKKELCTNNCYDRGNCQYGKCFCDAGFAGVDCGIKLKCPNNCSNRGICFREKCLCEPGYAGKDCSVISFDFKPCNSNCNDNGICKLEKCFCYPGYSGKFCENKNEFACPPSTLTIDRFNISNTNKLKSNITWTACNGNGVCKYGMCFCYPGFKGKDCSKSTNLISSSVPVSTNSTVIHKNENKSHKIMKMKFREVNSEINTEKEINLMEDEERNKKILYSSLIILSIVFVILISFISIKNPK